MSQHSGLPVYAKKETGGWSICVKVQPGAKKSEVAGMAEENIRIRLSAPAVENKANKALIEFIAKKLGLRLSKVRLISGDKGRQKRIFLESEIEPNWLLLA